MMDFALNFCGWTCLLCLGLNRLGKLKWAGGGKPLLLAAALLAIVILIVPRPFLPVSLFQVLRGLCAGLSVSAVTLLIALLWQNATGRKGFADGERTWLPVILTLIALCFYPFALGFSAIDPYAWGFDGALALPLTVGIAALLAWLSDWRVSALALVLALAIWRLQGLESSNLWDALFDPLLMFGALSVLVGRLLRKRSA